MSRQRLDDVATYRRLRNQVFLCLDSEGLAATPIQHGAEREELVVFLDGFADFATTMIGAKLAALAALWAPELDRPLSFRRARAGEQRDRTRELWPGDRAMAQTPRLVRELMTGYLVAQPGADEDNQRKAYEQLTETAVNLAANADNVVDMVTLTLIVAPPDHRESLALILTLVAQMLPPGELRVARAAVPVAVEMAREGRSQAIALLGALGDPAALPVLLDAMTGPDELCVEAIGALEKLALPDTLELLCSVAADRARSVEIRIAAANALGALGAAGTAALPTIEAMLE